MNKTLDPVSMIEQLRKNLKSELFQGRSIGSNIWKMSSGTVFFAHIILIFKT